MQLKHTSLPISVVIPTLGGTHIGKTINALNSDAFIPKEIILCIPSQCRYLLGNLNWGNVKILVTDKKGQVSQRSHGFKNATEQIVLQLDDDVILAQGSFFLLYETLAKMGNGNILAPLYKLDEEEGFATSISNGLYGFISDAYNYFVCGTPWGLRRMGSISKIGAGIWFDRSLIGDCPVQSEWLPGGCVMCYATDVISEDYYPFDGKAYTEDLVHSILWRKNGCRLLAVPTATCITVLSDDRKAGYFNFVELCAQLRAQHYVVKLLSVGATRYKLWAFIYIIRKLTESLCFAILSSLSFRRKGSRW